VFRKFKVGTIFTAPNLQSLGGVSSPFMNALLSNCPTKITFGNCTPAEYAWWEEEFGKRREWKIETPYNTKDPLYGSELGKVAWEWKDTMFRAKIQGLKFKACIYKTKDKKGKNIVNYGSVDFLESKYNEPFKVKNYNFDKFNTAILEEKAKKPKKPKFNASNVGFDDEDNVDPVKVNKSDSPFLFTTENSEVKPNSSSKKEES